MNFSSKADKSRLLTIIGMIVMILFVATKAIPSLHVEGYSILVGIAFFFINRSNWEDTGSTAWIAVYNDLVRP